MLIILLDEPRLFVFSSAAAAEREIEAIDAESEIRAAFDDSGVPYCVEWVRPNRWGKVMFDLSVEPGEYRLVPDGPPDPKALIELLDAHPGPTDPPEAQSELISLLKKLRDAG